jgi:integrase
MAPTHKMTAKEVERIVAPGMHRIDEGLYLQIKDAASRSWIHRYTLKNKARWSGLGSYPAISLANARAARDDERAQIRDGIDPVAQRRQARQVQDDVKPKKTFRDCAADYMANHEGSWKNDKHRQQWPSTLQTYVYPIIGDLPVDTINTEHVRSVLQPIWYTKSETARRIRGRIEAILSFAKALELRSGENPARYRDHLVNVFPERTKRSVKHHAALPYAEMAPFMSDLRQREGTAARALEFLILTAARTGETIGATWSEIDLPNRLWTISAMRMKADKEHRVPLSSTAVAVLEKMKTTCNGDVTFPGMRGGQPLSNMSLLAVLSRMDRGDLTAHGFRSSFRDWAAECTNFPREVVEMALAHAIGDKVEAAYRRGDLFEKRRRLMDAWAKFCTEGQARRANDVMALRPAS